MSVTFQTVQVFCRRCQAEFTVPGNTYDDTQARQWMCKNCADLSRLDCWACNPIPENNWNKTYDSPLQVPLCWRHQEELVPRWLLTHGLPAPTKKYRVLPGVGETIKAKWENA